MSARSGAGAPSEARLPASAGDTLAVFGKEVCWPTASSAVAAAETVAAGAVVLAATGAVPKEGLISHRASPLQTSRAFKSVESTP